MSPQQATPILYLGNLRIQSGSRSIQVRVSQSGSPSAERNHRLKSSGWHSQDTGPWHVPRTEVTPCEKCLSCHTGGAGHKLCSSGRGLSRIVSWEKTSRRAGCSGPGDSPGQFAAWTSQAALLPQAPCFSVCMAEQGMAAIHCFSGYGFSAKGEPG